MKHGELKKHLKNDFVSVIRVVPMPMRSGWCIDLLLKELFAAGSRTETLESDRSTRSRPKIRRFASIDSAGQYLKSLGVSAFRVETDAAISFAQFDNNDDDQARENRELEPETQSDTRPEKGRMVATL